MILGILILAFILYLSLTFGEESSKKEECKTHKWVYKQQPGQDDEYLVCENCNKMPGVENE